jgi:hypothetical protein
VYPFKDLAFCFPFGFLMYNNDPFSRVKASIMSFKIEIYKTTFFYSL